MSFEKEVWRVDGAHGGDGDVYLEWQPGSGSYLATTGPDSVLAIWTRAGSLHHSLRLPAPSTGFGWSSDGDLLAAICMAPGAPVTVWDSNSGRTFSVDTGLRDELSVVAWARSEPLLAVASIRGNLAIYNHRTSKRMPILGKHSKKILSGAWAKSGVLALASEDRTVSISNQEGDTVRVVPLRGDPFHIQFGLSRTTSKISLDTMLSVVVSRKSLFLYNLDDPDNPVELTFQGRYGTIVNYHWYGDGLVLIGFSSGYLVSISTNVRDLGHEQFQVKNHHNQLSYLAIDPSLSRVATCGDNVVKVQDVGRLSEVSGVIRAGDGAERAGWSADGQLLAIADSHGSLLVYLARLPSLCSAHNNLVAVLTSLSTVTLNIVKGKGVRGRVNIEGPVEPTLLAVGPFHLILGMNNRTWLYDIAASGDIGGTANTPLLLGDREYVSNVTSLKLNAEYTSALLGDKLYLQLTESVTISPREEREMKIWDGGVTCHALTTDFLVIGTSGGSSDGGSIVVFGLEDWAVVWEKRLPAPVRGVHPDPAAARIVILDDAGGAWLISATEDVSIPLEEPPGGAVGALWDSGPSDRDVFILFDETIIVTYLHIRRSVDGAGVARVGETKDAGGRPVALNGGVVTLLAGPGRLNFAVLSTHSNQDSSTSNLDKHLALARYVDCWNCCMVLRSDECWEKLAQGALKRLELELALRVYRHLAKPALAAAVHSLILNIDDKSLLAAAVAELLGEFDKAQGLYLESSEPDRALKMRERMLQWDRAIDLARTLAPDRLSFVSLQHAKQLEIQGEWSEALVQFERSIEGLEEDLRAEALGGVCRVCLRLGDTRRGISIALESRETRLILQAAEILDSTKKTMEAAALYEAGKDYDRAAHCYVTLKNWNKLTALLPHITNVKVFQQYAKARESAGDSAGAVEGYIKAGDATSAVRLLLRGKQAQRAADLVIASRDPDAARRLAEYLEQNGDHEAALRFAVLSRSENFANNLCKEHGLVELYAELLEECEAEGRERRLGSLGQHFHQAGKHLLAARCYYHAAHFPKGVRKVIEACRGQAGSDDEALALGVEMVAAANDDALASQLLQLLLGEIDGQPRDPKFVFGLYKARKQYKEAARTAVIIASEELTAGNYSVAHSVLVGMWTDLSEAGLPVGSELSGMLTLLHSYRLARLHVRRGDHPKAARLLLRVADSVSKFPAHAAAILTSTVIECHRADLKASALKYAILLMNPEYKPKIEGKYVKKMEGVVRKGAGKGDQLVDPQEETTPCPYCSHLLPNSSLACSQCANTIPFCIATGWHIIKEDFTSCPNCQFPAIKSQLMSLLSSGEKECPMCGGPLDTSTLAAAPDVDPDIYLHPATD